MISVTFTFLISSFLPKLTKNEIILTLIAVSDFAKSDLVVGYCMLNRLVTLMVLNSQKALLPRARALVV